MVNVDLWNNIFKLESESQGYEKELKMNEL